MKAFNYFQGAVFFFGVDGFFATFLGFRAYNDLAEAGFGADLGALLRLFDERVGV